MDADVLDSDLYYVVTANDVHENQSGPSNEVGVGTTSVGEGPFPITALKILSNRPNPFASSTIFRVGLPTASSLAIDVFDVTGRRIRTQGLIRNEGWQDIRFDGLSDAGQPLPNGMYFYRITAGVTTITRKIMIAR